MEKHARKGSATAPGLSAKRLQQLADKEDAADQRQRGIACDHRPKYLGMRLAVNLWETGTDGRLAVAKAPDHKPGGHDSTKGAEDKIIHPGFPTGSLASIRRRRRTLRWAVPAAEARLTL
jgi:hypothetical protein